ncbi:MAG: hypothetical protein AAB797_00545 [Patescibacteria group bacterium]
MMYKSGLVGGTLSEEDIKKAKELLSRIYAMLKPLVENLVRPLVLQELANPSQQLTDEQKQAFTALPDDGLSDRGKELLNEYKQAVFNLQPLTNEEMEEEASGAVAEELQMLVNGWIEMFLCGKPSCDGSHYIQANTIDDAMLPPLQKDGREAFQEQFMNTILDESQVLAILRQLRASLPAGKVLPDEMVELLTQWRVKIV